MQTLDSHPELVTPSESKWHVFCEKTDIFLHVSNAFVLTHSVLLCARPRLVPTWCNNNDVTTMTGLPVRHYGFVFDMDLLKQTGHRHAAQHPKCFTQNDCFWVIASFGRYTLISTIANERQKLKLTWSHSSKDYTEHYTVYIDISQYIIPEVDTGTGPEPKICTNNKLKSHVKSTLLYNCFTDSRLIWYD